MATFYTGVDKSIHQGGDYYVPMDKFRLNPYEKKNLSYTSESRPQSYGITNTNAFVNSGGGDGDNYRTDYRPNYDYRKSLDYNPELSDLQNQKIMQNTLNYKGHDYYNKPAPTGLAKGINAAMNYIPFIGPMKRGAEFLGDALGKYMPVNRRAIMENELRGAGVYTDDIGRIVAGPDGYNTAEGIMAGYNANQMTDKTFDKRTKTIANTLSNKYGVDISSLSEEEIANFDPNNPAYNLVNRYNLINQARTNYFNTKKKADDIYEWEKKQKELARHKDGDRMSDTQAEEYIKGKEVTHQSQEFDGTPEPPGGQPGHGEGMAELSPDPVSDAGGSAEWGDMRWSRGGRVGFFAHGGRVYLNLGGLASIL